MAGGMSKIPAKCGNEPVTEDTGPLAFLGCIKAVRIARFT